MNEYHNGNIRLDIRSSYKVKFEFTHLLNEYILCSLLTSRIQIRIRIIRICFSALMINPKIVNILYSSPRFSFPQKKWH